MKTQDEVSWTVSRKDGSKRFIMHATPIPGEDFTNPSHDSFQLLKCAANIALGNQADSDDVVITKNPEEFTISDLLLGLGEQTE